MDIVEFSSEFIKLGQALKLANLVDNGGLAKAVINDGLVSVDGEVDTRRGRKLFGGEIIEFEGQQVKVVNNVHRDNWIKRL